MLSGDGEFDEDEYSAARFSPKYDIFPILIAAGIIVTNSFAVYLIWRHHRLRTITNAALVSLAFSDFLTGVFGTPLYIFCSSTYETHSCIAAAFFMKFTSVSTVLHLLLVTVDRYIAIQHSIRYTTLVTARSAQLAITSVWLISSLATLVPLAWTSIDTDVTKDGEDETVRKNKIYSIISLVLFTVIPTLAMIFSYVKILLVVRRTRKNILKDNIPFDQQCRMNAQRKHLRAERKTIAVFTSMVVFFILCWVPYFVLSLQHDSNLVDLPEWVEYMFVIYPRFLTSLLNPMFYMFGKLDFKEVLKPLCASLLKCFCCKKLKNSDNRNNVQINCEERKRLSKTLE